MVMTSKRRKVGSQCESFAQTNPWNQLERGSQFERGRRSWSGVVYKSFLLRRMSRHISNGYVRRWSWVNIREFCEDQRMVWVRKHRPTCRASNVWAHEVVSNVYEYHDTKNESSAVDCRWAVGNTYTHVVLLKIFSTIWKGDRKWRGKTWSVTIIIFCPELNENERNKPIHNFSG